MSTAPRFRPNRTVTEQVEQAIARGWSLDRITDELGVADGMVDQVLRGMDAANRTVDHGDDPTQRCGTYAGYKRHACRAEPACHACRRANTRYRAHLRRVAVAAGAADNEPRRTA